jgi:phage recombination protein Bet
VNAVVAHEQPVSGVVAAMADRFGMDKRAFESTLRATIMPANCSQEQVAAFLLVAKQHDLNPFTKEIFAFPSRGGIQPIVSVDGWMKLTNSHPQFDGMDFYDHFSEDGKLFSIQCKIHRKDRSHPIEVTEYMSECYRDTDTWKRWPARMLRHKAAIQCARYAFGFAGIIEQDEYERLQEVEVTQQPNWSTMTKEQKDEHKRIACESSASQHSETVAKIKAAIVAADGTEDADEKRALLMDVAHAWYALPQEAQIALYSAAPTKGGIFTTHERDVLKSSLPKLDQAAA